jgi:hypothetical protein
MVWAWNLYGVDKKIHGKFWWEDLLESCHCEDRSEDNIKIILEKWVGL